MTLNTDRFAEFFAALYRFSPFPWQTRLAAQVADDGQWPDCIAVPTASGKTACIDIAVFALACQASRPAGQRTAPRRIFFVVDRRVIVDEAFERAKHLAEELAKAEGGVLREVADALRELSRDSDAPPLDTYQLRGGIYRDDSWVRSPLQPTVIASTVDQVGSRLLFRGYGVSDNAKPIHAALIGNDSLIVLDEGHCAQPFRDTATAVDRYRGENWADTPFGMPFQFVEMSATPRNGTAAFHLDDDDKAHPVLSARRDAAKPAHLSVAKGASGKNTLPKLARHLHDKAEELAGCEATPQAIAIIVNRVRTAKLLHEKLKKKHPDRVHLMIGRMRSLDRDRLTGTLQTMFSCQARSCDKSVKNVEYEQNLLPGFNTPESHQTDNKPHFVIATQCLEVGADFDFDAMVCECASLDALRQRFGRLNRMGRPLSAQAAVVICEGDIKVDPKKPDPIYGTALPETWKWLNEHATAGSIDFGIGAMDEIWKTAQVTDADLANKLQPPAPHAPVMLPAHVDCWCQTSPMPTPDPDVSLFLHGPERGQPEVKVCWRADLGTNPDPAAWPQAVSLCPPVSTECLSVPIWLFRQWLFCEETDNDALTDVLGGASASVENTADTQHSALIWRGPTESKLAQQPADIRVGDTIVLPVEAGGWETFGHIPDAPPSPTPDAPLPREVLTRLDLGSEAYRTYRGKAILRLHPAIWPTDEALGSLREWAADSEDNRTLTEVRRMLADAARETTDDQLRKTLRALATPQNGLVIGRYFGAGAVLHTQRRIDQNAASLGYDDRDDTTSTSEQNQPIPLAEHQRGVAAWAERFGSDLGELKEPLTLGGCFHDLGKADPRQRAYMRQASLPDAQLYAKHPKAPSSYEEHRRACERSGRPERWRHELLSVALLQDRLKPELPNRDLVLHLLGAHHGYCRPFAPALADPEPVQVSVQADGSATDGPEDTLLKASSATGLERLDSGVPERFWQLTRRHGWWGLPYLEALVRLADWKRSADENRGLPAPPASLPNPRTCVTPTPKPRAEPPNELLLVGLDGANPLAFLAALGTLRTLTHAWPDSNVKMSWRQHAGAWRPVLHASEPLNEQQFLEALITALPSRFAEHPSALVENLQTKDADHYELFRTTAQRSTMTNNHAIEWLTCLTSDIGKDETNQLQVVRRDYFMGNLRSIIENTSKEHLQRALLWPWDYADSLDNQSLHWDPSEDRRYALQWHRPAGDPHRRQHGGMLGANRLATEALPLHPLIVMNKGTQTVGFQGHGVHNTEWSWPIWSAKQGLDATAALLRHPDLQDKALDMPRLRKIGISAVCRSRRILAEQTPNLTPASVLSS